MSDLAATSTFRLTVRGPAGSVDLTVPPGADVESVGREYARAFGKTLSPVLVTTTGRPLEPRRPLRHLGVEAGDVLVALELDSAAAAGEGGPTGGEGPSTSGRAVAGPSRAIVVGGSVVCAWLAAMIGVLGAPGPSRSVSAGALLAAALVANLAVPALRGALGTAHAMAAPAFAGAAGLLLAHSDDPGGGLLGWTAAGLAAGVAAAVARAGADDRTERLLRVWLVTAGVVALSAAVTLATGAPESSLWAWLFLLAVVAARLLPYLVVDVPDEVLLDIDRLAVTAWSARERPRRGRRRLVVRPQGVADVVRAGRDLLVAGAVAVALVATTATVMLVRGPGSGIESLGVHLLLLLGGGALALTSRSYRATAPRAALRLPAGLALTAVLVAWLEDLSGAWLWGSLAVLATAAVAVVVAAVSLGRGWRSVWWARTAEVVEGLTVVLCVASFPVAAGLFGLVRQLPS